jgi:hypothetical protein
MEAFKILRAEQTDKSRPCHHLFSPITVTQPCFLATAKKIAENEERTRRN